MDWHFHENDYFTFILEGGMTEANKKEQYECSVGVLLYHNWQDAHYNIASGRFTRGFHVELSPAWYDAYDINDELTQGSINISNPHIKTLMYTKYRTITWAPDEFYGYLFWNKVYHVKNKACETFYCSGNGGNKIFVFKDQPLVIVITPRRTVSPMPIRRWTRS